MRITQQQEKALNEFVCQRLSADPGNKKLVRSFENNRNGNLAAYLRFFGCDEDAAGTTTIYVIKDQQNRIAMYFSLKCGSLNDPLNLKELSDQIDEYYRKLDAIQNSRKGTAKDQEEALVEQLMLEYGMNIRSLQKKLQEEMQALLNKRSEVANDQRTDPNQNITRVVKTYPAVELVQFVANDEYRSHWRKLAKTHGFGNGHTMTQIFFWHFIAPIICDIHKVLGCQYAYLFAADQSLHKRLINFYQSALNFTQDGNIGATKPRYDFTCEFMYQEIAEMRKFRYEYFDKFNPDPDEEAY